MQAQSIPHKLFSNIRQRLIYMRLVCRHIPAKFRDSRDTAKLARKMVRAIALAPIDPDDHSIIGYASVKLAQELYILKIEILVQFDKLKSPQNLVNSIKKSYTYYFQLSSFHTPRHRLLHYLENAEKFSVYKQYRMAISGALPNELCEINDELESVRCWIKQFHHSTIDINAVARQLKQRNLWFPQQIIMRKGY